MDLEDLFRSHQRELFAYFLRIVRDAHSAEELAQETMVRACGAALRFRGSSSVRTWLFGIAHRVLLEASRAGLFDRFDSVDEDRPEDPSGLSPGERVDLERALATLRPGDRETLVMVDMLGFEPIEVAAMLRDQSRHLPGASPSSSRPAQGGIRTMNEEPLDLRGLADVEEPDVLREALRTFRRRVLTRYVWISVGICLAIATAVWGLQPSTLRERMGASSPTYQATAVWHPGGASVGLARVVDLGDTVGLHFVVLPRGHEGSGGWTLEVSEAVASEIVVEEFATYFEVRPSSDGRYSVTASFDFGHRGEFTIDLSKVGVPSSLWKESS